MSFLIQLNDILKKYDGIVDALAVIATFTVVIVSLKIARLGIIAKVKAKIQTRPSTAQVMYPENVGPVPPVPGFLDLVVYNKGFSEVYVRKTGLRWCMPLPSCFSLPVYIKDTSNIGDPSCIRPGSALTCTLMDNVEWEINRIIEDNKFEIAKKWGWHHFLYLELTTDSQKSFKVKLPRELKDIISWAVANGH